MRVQLALELFCVGALSRQLSAELADLRLHVGELRLILKASRRLVGLQRAVSNYHGFDNGYGYNGFSNGYSYAQPAGYAPTYAPNVASPTWAPQNTLAAQTDLASHNSTSFMSPDQYAGANSQQGGFNLGFGDITLGSKTTASNGAAVINGNTRCTGHSSCDAIIMDNGVVSAIPELTANSLDAAAKDGPLTEGAE